MIKYDIVLVNLDPTIGHEVKKTRPCVVLSPDEMNNVLKTVIVAPITSTQRAIPTRVLIKSTQESGLSNDSYAMLDQIKTIDKKRVIKELGAVSEDERQALTNCLQDLFAL
ncbi:MAG: type II toxin-antitoxin system PemK/MazF family toxin [Muribaculaceae bacterium]|nr:type II toxin-antitoxin system PemK/MazF family toxin [Muribaculaceae bacterium]